MSANAQAVTPAEQKAAAPVPALSNEMWTARILVVDDQPANIQIVGAALGKLGCEIIPASDGPTALKRVALRMPDLILLDLFMPGMNGYEVCLQLKLNPDWKDIPVIFLSAAECKGFDCPRVGFRRRGLHHQTVQPGRTHFARADATGAEN